jgi:hypothetical protein
MNFLYKKLLFAPADYALIRAVDETLDDRNSLGRLSSESGDLHPRGIKELAEPRAIRMTRTMLRLIYSPEVGAEALKQRLRALQALRDEVIDGMDSPLKFNSARVLLQMMKELVRARREDMNARLRLAHDIHNVLLGNPTFIRKMLQRYKLLELPENWQPITFDYHIHNTNTQGRKSPTHLVMDAWIKGIFKLQVVYHNHLPEGTAEELLSAARILHLDARIGVEFSVIHAGKKANLIWTPQGFASESDLIKLLDNPSSQEFIRKCREAAEYRRRLMLVMLRRFNRQGRLRLNTDYEVALPSVRRGELLGSVTSGQPSPEHISELIVMKLQELLEDRLVELSALRTASARRKLYILRKKLENLNVELIKDKYLDTSLLSALPEKLETLPALNRMSPAQLLDELHKISTSFRVTLCLAQLRLEDVLEILYDCKGGIDAIEMFSLKHFGSNGWRDEVFVNELRHALNGGVVVKLKNLIRFAVGRIENDPAGVNQARLDHMHGILQRMPLLIEYYSKSPLKATIGSSSSPHQNRRQSRGIGLVLVDTLTGNIRRRILKGRDPDREILPATAEICKSYNYLPGRKRSLEFRTNDNVQQIGNMPGNIATLGRGVVAVLTKDPSAMQPVRSAAEFWQYLNNNLKIVSKILLGFSIAFASFYWTQNWWFLMWFGAPIWFGITGIRNIIQSIAAGGGWRSSPLLKWNDFVSWQRVADSLLYTGISVPLLDYVVKTLILSRLVGWTAENNPIGVFTAIAVANGIYISTHNILRGLSRAAVFGNWLRAPLAVPLAIGFSSLLGGVLGAFGVPDATQLVQNWAAIISKLSSDIIAAFIESRADRRSNLKARFSDYQGKLREFFVLFSRLELMLPDDDVPARLEDSSLSKLLNTGKGHRLIRQFYVNALDVMYIRFRQPQGYAALRQVLGRLSPEERNIFLKLQETLRSDHEISKLFLNGLVGRNFSRALAFYLHYYSSYLNELKRLGVYLGAKDPVPTVEPPKKS